MKHGINMASALSMFIMCMLLSSLGNKHHHRGTLGCDRHQLCNRGYKLVDRDCWSTMGRLVEIPWAQAICQGGIAGPGAQDGSGG